MSGFIVEGKCKVQGTIRVTGNKNEALPLIAASLLCRSPLIFSNVPDIGDVRAMLSIATILGAKVSPLRDGQVTIDASELITTELPAKESSAIRASILFASALLVRKGHAEIRQPGGAPATEEALGVLRAMLRAGFIVLPEGEHSNTISFTPPLVITRPQLAAAARAFGQALKNLPFP